MSNQPGALRDTVVAAGVFDDFSVSESRNGWRKHQCLPISWGFTAKEDAQSQGTDKSNQSERVTEGGKLPIETEIQRAAETQLDVECTPAKLSSERNTTELAPNPCRLNKEANLKTTPNRIHVGSVSPATRKAPIRLHKTTTHV